MRTIFTRLAGGCAGKSVITLAAITLMLLLLASPAEAAKYVTSTDNENNAKTGVADNDMGSGSPPCIFNYDSNHPIEFNINVSGSLPTQNAYLAIFIGDVDWPSQVDEVFLNGHSLGYATGQDDLDYSTLFVIPDLSWVVPGNNLVEVLVDRNNGDWCAQVEWGQLVIDEGTGSGPAFIRTATTNQSSYDYGDTVNVALEVDTTLATQNVRLELVLRDPNGQLINFDTNAAIQNWALTGTNNEPYTWSFALPGSGTNGVWAVSITVYDQSTGQFQAHRTLTFAVPEASTPPPTVTSVTPDQGAQGTATAVVISGTNFLVGDTACTVGGVAITNQNVVNNNTVSGNVSAALAVGQHNVTCTTSYGSSTLTGGFTVFSAAPTLTSITPSQGNEGTEIPVVIAGTNFVAGQTTCTIAGFSLMNLSVTSPTSLTATIPGTLPPGDHDLTCSTPSGSATLPASFEVIDTPAVPTVEPLAIFLLMALLAIAGVIAARHL